MSNFQIHQLSSGAISRHSNIIHDTEVNGVYGTRKDLAGSVADLNNIQIANEFDNTSTYNYGDYCIREGVLYRNIVPITVAEAWTPAHWTAVMVTGEYKRVRIMTKAQFDLLSNDEKDGFIYVSDYPTKIQDIDNVTLTTSDNNKLLGSFVENGEVVVMAVDLFASDTVSISSGVTANKVQLLKYGKVVFLTMAIKVSSPSSWQVIGTIPSAYFPKWSVYGVMINTTSANNLQTAHINVEPDGRIRLANTLPDSRDTYTFDLMWIIE